MLRTERLDLIPLSKTQLRLYLEHADLLEAELSFRLSRTLITDIAKRAIRMKLEKMEKADPKSLDWYTYWLIVIRELHFGAGLIGFKGIPNEQGESEIGYGMDPMFQGRGYATEATKAMIDWAFFDPDCQVVTALKVVRTNIASQHVLQKCGLVLFSEDNEFLNFRLRKSSFC